MDQRDFFKVKAILPIPDIDPKDLSPPLRSESLHSAIKDTTTVVDKNTQHGCSALSLPSQFREHFSRYRRR